MNAQDIRKAYLDFFAKKQHVVIPRANLVPQNDPTTLFTGSGMQPLLPYLLGAEHPAGIRVVNSQTSFRAEDIDEVGDNRHTTFFEMLGNWSFGDYFKEQQIKWIFEFLTGVVGIDPSRLYMTCFIGAPQFNIPKDIEAAEAWQQLFRSKGIVAEIAEIGSEADGYTKGIKAGERIFYYDGKKNWWNRGKTSPETTPIGDPCGPDSEMFYDFGTLHDQKYGKYCHPNCDCGRFMEIGNNVFMAYRKVAEGRFEPLERPNIDHGSGLERIAAAVINEPDTFRISVLWPIIEELETISSKAYESNAAPMRVIADHLRAAVFLAVDGVTPSNKGQGYVMRRLIRRATVKAFDLGIEQNFLEQVVPTIIRQYRHDFPELAEHEQAIADLLVREEKVFRQTLRKGLREFELLTRGAKTVLSGDMLFMLYDTYGFPIELTKEQAFARGIDLASSADADFIRLMQQQRERSQTATKGQFKGGLEGHSEIHKKYHTATHLMYKALKMILGDHVVQRGSNITEERLRFDFSHPEKMTPEQIKQVEAIVNEQITKDLKVHFEELPTKEAFARGASGAFGDKYGEKVRVYIMGRDGEEPYSIEICGGPHVEHTGALAEGGKHFKIIKEEASSAGIRRIKAVLT